MKDELPRVAYNNPAILIHVERKLKAKEEQWDPELVVELGEFLTELSCFPVWIILCPPIALMLIYVCSRWVH